MANNKNRQPMGAVPQQLVNMSKEALESSIEMKCFNEIPIDEKPGEFMQCGGEVFVDASRLKYISPIMSPTGQQTIATVAIGKLCVACGKIFSPDEWLKQNSELEKTTILDKEGKPT